MKRIKQINNLVIKLDDAKEVVYGAPFGVAYRGDEKRPNPNYNTYSVWHGSVCLEDRLSYEQAVEYAREIKDYLNSR